MVSHKAYERAEKFLPKNIESLVLNDNIDIHWIGDSDRFWYRRECRNGKEFIQIDPDENTRTPAFEHERLEEAIARETGILHDQWSLPFDEFEYTDDESAILFSVQETQYKCDLSTYTCETIPQEEEHPGESPDGRWIAFIEDHNLYVRDTENQEVIQLTSDGEEQYGYATPYPSPVDMVDQNTQDIDHSIEVKWSPDSNRLVTYQLDQRSARQFALVQSSPDDQMRPRHYTYTYPLPGENGLPLAEPVVFNVKRRSRVELDVDPIPVLYFGGEPLLDWYGDSERLHYIRRSRGFGSAKFFEVDSITGSSRMLIEEESDTLVDPRMSHARVINDGEEILWTSERSGWHHIYLIDGKTGDEKHQITDGEWVVRDIKHVDENNRQIYFTASGREANRDPYLRHLYRVNFDGSNLTLLTPELADHTVTISPSGDFVVDIHSRVDTPPSTVLRQSASGDVIQELEKAEVGQLRSTGWMPPKSFEVTAADGETDIYGVMWRPSDFDPTKQYPVIEHIYTGPHNYFVPKGFDAYRSNAQSIAELGFVVVMVDGRGTGRRSKAFRDCSYKNLSRDGIEDHKAALCQLAEEHSYMDLSRVGIYGHSAGGYDSARALLQHPDFYNVAVSSSGNHDHRLDKASWNEMWMDYPVDDHYSEQSNITLADQLEGKLLLVHGELDQNVHPAATLRFANALMKANNDFDMLIIPNVHHSLDGHPYFIRARWDYFVKYLHNIDPPNEYEIKSYQ
ncbi:DPP IV N-terminal domain-containing protein [Haladaptatus sp. SPP-AMP-3]|uniref:S9 family peptidase n=1 Tax=Haladaptatus sp. SPP-AMP-3 TaxID=3121295 RepID=UPI003C2FDD41